MRTRTARVLIGIALAAATVGIGVGCVSKQVRSGNDFPIYFEAARTLLRGSSPYDVTSGLHGYVYLPFFALVLAPLTALPLAAAAWVWYLANVCLAVTSIRIAIRVVRAGDAGRLPGWVAVVATVLLLGFFHDNLALGQVNLLLLFLVVSAIGGLLIPGERAMPAMLLGVAAALKMNLAILVVPILIRRQLRPAAGFAAGAAGAILLPLALLGPARGVDLTAQWRAKVVAPAAAGTLQGSKIWDQSPQAALRRFLVDAPAFGQTRVNLAAMSQAAFARVVRAVGAAFLIAILLLWCLGPGKERAEALLLDYGIGCCGILQVVGFNLKAQFVLLLIPALVAASQAYLRPRTARRGLGVALLLVGLLLLISNPGLVGRTISNVALAYSSVTLATLILLVVLARLRYESSEPVVVVGSPA